MKRFSVPKELVADCFHVLGWLRLNPQDDKGLVGEKLRARCKENLGEALWNWLVVQEDVARRVGGELMSGDAVKPTKH